MTQSTRKTSPKSNDKALAAFVSRKAEIDSMLARLQSLSDEHFNYSPDEINWGHVGTISHYALLLKRITDSAFQEGEHADSCRRGRDDGVDLSSTGAGAQPPATRSRARSGVVLVIGLAAPHREEVTQRFELRDVF